MTSALPIALAIALLAQSTTRAKPDFLGSWTMDRNRSESVTTEKVAGPITLAVSQTETTLSIQTRRGDQSEVAVQHGYTMRGAQTYALVKDVYIRSPRE